MTGSKVASGLGVGLGCGAVGRRRTGCKYGGGSGGLALGRLVEVGLGLGSGCVLRWIGIFLRKPGKLGWRAVATRQYLLSNGA